MLILPLEKYAILVSLAICKAVKEPINSCINIRMSEKNLILPPIF